MNKQIKKTLLRSLILLFTLPFVFVSCTSEDPDAIAKRDREKIINYLSDRGLLDVAVEDPSGLFYIVEEEGTGAHPQLNSWIRIRYLGYLLEDTTKVFDSSSGSLIQLANTIEGWRVGIPKFRNGGKGKLLVPSAMGYGAFPPFGGAIPRHASLVFEFTIIDVN